MKKMLLVLSLVIVLLTGCVANPHTLTYVEGKDVVIDETELIGLFFDYTNGSGETAIPCEWVDVKAFQNGVELTIMVYTGQRMDGAVQCDASIQAGTTARVVWLFEKVDDSPVSVEVSNGESFVVGGE